MVRLGSVPLVIISHPELLVQAFAKEELADRGVRRVVLAMTGGRGLFTAPYDEHWRRNSQFTKDGLLSDANMALVRERYIEPVATELVERMGRKADAGELVHPNDMVDRSTFDLAVRQLLGEDRGDTAELRRVREILWDDVHWTRTAINKPDVGELFPWLSFLPSKAVREAQRRRGVREEAFRGLVESARGGPGYNPSSPACLMDFMLAREEAGDIPPEGIRDLLYDFIVAFMEGMPTTLKFFPLIVANRPEVQSRIQEELDRVVGRDAEPTVNDKPSLPYTFAAIAESMRYRTASPLGIGHQAMTDTEVGGFLVTAGTKVASNLYGIHHDPRFWESPDEFIPDRFMPQADGSPSPALTRGAFVPFGVGLRRCTGEQLGEVVTWVYLTKLLHHLRFETPEGSPVPEDEMPGLSIVPKPYALRVTRR